MNRRHSNILGLDGNPISMSSTYYEGATRSKQRTKGWHAPSTGPNTAIAANLPELRNRILAALRNGPFFKQALKRLVSNEIGTGIKPFSRAKEEVFRSEIDDIWEEWTAEADADGVLSFYGLQALIARSRRQSGEVFIRLRPRTLEYGLAIPFQIQIIEADYCPVHLSKVLSRGRYIKHGIEFDRRGRRLAYYMYKRHPSEWAGEILGINEYIRVPAREIIHNYQPLRPGQIRGEPEAAQSLLKNHTLNSYDDAELVRKETRAPYTGFLTRDAFDNEDFQYDPFSGEPLDADSEGFLDNSVRPGAMLQGFPGESLTLFDGDKGNDNYAPFMRQQLLAIMAGLGIPYELGTGDWKDVNDRLVRAILNEFRREIQMDQQFLDIDQVCKPIWKHAADLAVLAGHVKAPDYQNKRRQYLKHQWVPHAWAYIHPEQDIKAAVNEIDNHLASVDEHRLKRNRNPSDVDRQQAEAETRRKKIREEHGLKDELQKKPEENTNPT